jgi:hypothetical protein
MSPEGEWNELAYCCASEGLGSLSESATHLDIINYYVNYPPVISAAALIFPSSNSILTACSFTNVIWQITGITDQFGEHDLTITAMSVHYRDTELECAIITNDVNNMLGQIVWHVPAGLIDWQEVYLVRFEVEDHDGMHSSMLFHANPFRIVPEPFGLWLLLLAFVIIRNRNG